MNSPTHEEISRKAYALWEQRGRPAGADSAIWLEAETQLTAESQSSDHGGALLDEARPIESSTVGASLDDARARKDGQSIPSHAIAPTPIEQKVIVSELQKQAARAPQVPHQNAPKPQPAPPGKPVWSKPHGA